MTGRRSGQTRRVLVAAFIAIILLAVVGRMPKRIVYNNSASAPQGFYLVVEPWPLRRGALVLVALPDNWQAWAMERRYIGPEVPLVKRVAALGADHVCTRGDALFVNGRRQAFILQRDGQGRRLPSWRGCRSLAADEFLVLMPAEASLDGRYFGPLQRGQIIGRLEPLWLR